MDAAVTPFPIPDITPPVTKRYLVCIGITHRRHMGKISLAAVGVSRVSISLLVPLVFEFLD